MKWYAFYPSDTLFLRGAEPMVGGTGYDTTQLFPPPLSVISGAIRTAVLAQKKISIQRYRKGDAIADMIGAYGKKAPFNLIGPLIWYQSDYFIPAPYTWFVEEVPEDETPQKKGENDRGKNERGKDKKIDQSDGAKKDHLIHVYKASPLPEETITTLGLKTSTKLNGWVKHRHEIKSIGGAWVSLKAVMANQSIFENGKTIFLPQKESIDNGNAIFSREERIGIGIDSRRRVEEGKIYTARHIRLKPEMSLIWAVDGECGLAPEGVISIGGEQRFGKYQEITTDIDQMADFKEKTGTRYLALSPVPVTPESQKVLIASGKIIYRGGWDLAKQFHKPMRPYFPAGSVFNEKVDPGCICPSSV